MSDIPWAVSRLPGEGYGQLRSWAWRRIAACIHAVRNGALEDMTFGHTKGADYTTPTATTLAVYAALSLYTDRGREVGAHPSQTTVGTVAGIGRRAAVYHLRLLHALGVVDWNGKASAHGTNAYTVYADPHPVRDGRFLPVEMASDIDAYDADDRRQALSAEGSRHTDDLEGWDTEWKSESEPVSEPDDSERAATGDLS